ncbi:MAG: molybdopterin-binding protein [Roseovarius sp.]
MKFGTVPLAEAEGAILAHALRLPGGKLRKGHLLDAADLAALRAAGIAVVSVARPDPGDRLEGEAAEEVARALAEGAEGVRVGPPFTGRVNLLAEAPGLALIDAARIHAANAVDPMITVATVAPFHQMHPGGMIATIKIIAYAVPGAAVARAAEAGRGAVRLARPVLRRASLIVTQVPGGPGEKGIEAIRARLEAFEMTLAETLGVPHREAPLADAIRRARGDLILILTGSATSDPHDVAPQALRRAGGRVERFGMPVDPGNLLFLGALGERPVIGLPNSARSPVLHGADWVLGRVVCGLAPSAAEIGGWGVGGLLKEIPTRPQPRQRARPLSTPEKEA